MTPNKTKSDPAIQAKITDISLKGLVTIRFNRLMLEIANATEVLTSDKVLEVTVKSNSNNDASAIHSWGVVQMTEQSLYIQLTFENPDYVSMSDVRDSLQVKFIDNQFFIDKITRLAIKQGSILQKTLPPQTKEDGKTFIDYGSN